MYTYIHIYTQNYKYIYICVYAYIYVNMCVCIYKYVQMYIHIYIYVEACSSHWAKIPGEHARMNWSVNSCVFPEAFSSVGRARFHKNQLRVTWDQCDSTPPFQALYQTRVWIVIQGWALSLKRLLYWRLADQCYWLQVICLTRLQLVL